MTPEAMRAETNDDYGFEDLEEQDDDFNQSDFGSENGDLLFDSDFLAELENITDSDVVEEEEKPTTTIAENLVIPNVNNTINVQALGMMYWGLSKVMRNPR